MNPNEESPYNSQEKYIKEVDVRSKKWKTLKQVEGYPNADRVLKKLCGYFYIVYQSSPGESGDIKSEWFKQIAVNKRIRITIEQEKG